MRIPNLITDRAAKLPGDWGEVRDKGASIGRKPINQPTAETKAALRARGRVRKRKGEMNEQEELFAGKLRREQTEGIVAWWGFEAVTLRLADRTTWTADFAVMYSTGSLWLIDVKGAKKTKAGNYKPFIEQHTAVKAKLAAELFPITIAVAYRLPKKCGGEWVIEKV